MSDKFTYCMYPLVIKLSYGAFLGSVLLTSLFDCFIFVSN